jgi:alpha-L-rhamnosidase
MKAILLSIILLIATHTVFSQDYYAEQRGGWLQKADASKPRLIETVERPARIVKLVEDPAAFQKWKAVNAGPLDSLYTHSFKRQSGVVLDFGRHITGTCSFSLKALRGVSDAPTRMKLTFGEVPAELATPFDPYTGALSRAWLQDEIITVMDIPTTITIERRMSFRYVKIELLGSSPYFDFALSDIQCKATTSAGKPVQVLANGTPKELEDIYNVGLATLQECMQTVYEDGPKRDRRLWIGDLYLESLANSYSFKNHELTKHCLYLLAGLANTDGFLYSNVFETPVPHAQVGAPFLFDYSLLYNVTVKEYVQATGDLETAKDLWPLIVRQMDGPEKFLLENGMFDNVAAANARWWLFVDWKDNLDRQAAIQGIIIFSMKKTLELAKLLGKEKDVADLPGLIKKMTDAARKNLWDKNKGVVVSGPLKQVSYASQAWLTLSGVLNQKEAQSALRYAMADQNAIRQGAPYLYHYFIEAMIQSGLEKEARQAVIDYWGGMVKKGADTFWEVYDPQNDFLSPYSFFPVNSYCHAWSCTPVYFIGKYPAIFQK